MEFMLMKSRQYRSSCSLIRKSSTVLTTHFFVCDTLRDKGVVFAIYPDSTHGVFVINNRTWVK